MHDSWFYGTSNCNLLIDGLPKEIHESLANHILICYSVGKKGHHLIQNSKLERICKYYLHRENFKDGFLFGGGPFNSVSYTENAVFSNNVGAKFSRLYGIYSGHP